MADHTDTATDHDSGADVGHDTASGRTTAPMSPYSARDVGIGLLVLLVGLAIAFALPLAVTL